MFSDPLTAFWALVTAGIVLGRIGLILERLGHVMGRLWSFLGSSFEAFLECVESVRGRLEALLSNRLRLGRILGSS